MIQSMTGYGVGNAVHKNLSVDVEIKSVNSRYYEAYLKIPSSLTSKEYELREIIKQKIQRGKINCIIQLRNNGVDNGNVQFDPEKLNNFLKMINKIQKSTGIKDQIKLEHILSSKELITSKETEISESEFELVKKSLNKAIDQLLKMRRNEGKELAKDLKNRIKAIGDKIGDIENEFLKGKNDYYEKLQQRVSELVGDKEIDKDRLNVELAFIADRADITEECVRLKSHLKFFLKSLAEPEPGRKLNFLCQEMNRETNTISSKSISTSVTHTAVFIKEEIEKIREQIQNLE
jgi:uncharacterized protein (TIGR00255 family)